MNPLLLHRASVRLAAGLLLCAALFDVLSVVAPEPYTFTRPTLWLLGPGLLAGVVAGVPALVGVTRGDTAGRARQVTRHAVLTDVALALFAASLAARWPDRRDAALDPVALVLSVLGAAALVAAAGSGVATRAAGPP